MTTNNDKPKPDAARRPLPPSEELRARGFKVLPPSGRGYLLPTGRPPSQPPGDAPPRNPPTGQKPPEKP